MSNTNITYMFCTKNNILLKKFSVLSYVNFVPNTLNELFPAIEQLM